LYRDVKSCIKLNNILTDFFVCGRGVRHGVNLSPILFSLYLNDLEHYLISQNESGVKNVDYGLDIFLPILVLLYAADTVLFGKSKAELISFLNWFSTYCDTWKLDNNVDKTKILVFGDRSGRNRDIVIKNKRFEIVDTFKYLGIVFFSRIENLPKLSQMPLNKLRKHVSVYMLKKEISTFRLIVNLNYLITLLFLYCYMVAKFGGIET